MPRFKPTLPCCLGIAAALLLPLLPQASLAASPDQALRSGSWAIELDKDASSTDAGIGILRHHSEHTAYRLNFDFSYNGNGKHGTQRQVPPGTGAPYRTGYYSRSYNVVLNWVHYFSISNDFAAQFGVGPAAYWSSYSSFSGTATNSYTDNSRQTQYGLEANLGVEWFFSKRLSLGGRVGVYAAAGNNTEIDTNTYGGGTQIDNTNGPYNSVRSENGRIILTGYF